MVQSAGYGFSSSSDVRPSPLAGRWYPANAEALTIMLDQYLDAAQPYAEDASNGQLVGLLAPHAGLQYSGPVAAHAFTRLKNMSFDTVVVIGPMHHPLPGRVLTTAHSYFETPLGSIRVDRDVLTEIGKTVHLTPAVNDPEHSIEIELPFLQRVLEPGFSLVPIMLRDQTAATTQALGAVLAKHLMARRVLMVASSDLSHFYPQQVANELDSTMLECVSAMDPQRVIDYNENGTAFACGYGAIATTLQVIDAWGANGAEIVGYATSGDATGDYSRVVGYGAAAFTTATNQ
jgi:MEMO1 family protein